MFTGSVSLSPVVVAQSIAENEIRQQITMKVLTEQMNAEANLTAKIISEATYTSKGELHISAPAPTFDRQM